jgi:hypothetical protein
MLCSFSYGALFNFISFDCISGEEIVFLQLDSRLSIDNLEAAVKQATQGCRQLRVLLENAFKVLMTDEKRRLNNAGRER